jgi:NitT/TauT family transport system permease protein
LFLLAGPEAISPPLQTAARLASLLESGNFWINARATLIAFFYACLISLIGGLVVGIALGFHRLSSEVAEPVLGTLYSIPKITLYPVILLIFGLGISAKVAFGALHGIFPVILFAMGAIKNINPTLLRTARVMRLRPLQTAASILLPAALPEILCGLRVGFSAALLGTIVGELFASDQGLGFMLIRAMERHDVPDILALTIFLFVFAAIANTALVAFEGRMSHATSRMRNASRREI